MKKNIFLSMLCITNLANSSDSSSCDIRTLKAQSTEVEDFAFSESSVESIERKEQKLKFGNLSITDSIVLEKIKNGRFFTPKNTSVSVSYPTHMLTLLKTQTEQISQEVALSQNFTTNNQIPKIGQSQSMVTNNPLEIKTTLERQEPELTEISIKQKTLIERFFSSCCPCASNICEKE